MYLRLTKNLYAVGRLIPENENPYNYVNQDEDFYLSIYKYNEDQKKFAEEKVEKEKDGKIVERNRGIVGIVDVVTNKLVFDFDTEHDLEKARLSTIEAIKRLIDIGFKKSDIQISFSGNKGFSVVIEHDQEISPEQHKAIGKSIAGDLEGFDTKVYNASRIFRLDYTKHNESGLYKTPIAYSQLTSLDAEKIKNLAKKKRNPKYVKKQPAKFPKSLLDIKVEEVTKVDASIEVNIDKLDFKSKPAFLTTEKFILHKGHIPKGYGNEGMMILAATYRSAGFDAVDAYNMLLSVNEKRGSIYGEEAKREESEIKNTVIDVVYSETWQGGQYSYKGNELLATLKEKYGDKDDKKALNKIGNIKERFKKFVKNINKNIIKSGIKSLDDKVMLMTGQLVGVLGAPGSGKTSLVTTIMENLSKNGINVLFESLDMHDNMMTMRMIQKLTGLDVEKKMRKMIKEDPLFDESYDMFEDKEVLDALEQMEKVYENVAFNFKRGTTVEDIDNHIIQAKELYGDNLKLVVVDYLEKVPTQFSDPTASTGLVARQLSDLASKHDVCVILLLQPQKSAGDASEELLSMRKIKGASVIEQDCRVILTMWRPGFDPSNPSTDKYASLAVVKNNMGESCKLDYAWNGLRGTLRELTPYEKSELADLVEKRKEEKKENDSW